MITKETLYKARKIDLEIDALIRARQKVFEQFTSATAVISAEPKGGTNPHKFDKLAELNDSIDCKLIENAEIKNNVFEAISRLDGKDERAIMLDYYINGFTLWFIAQKMNYSVKQIKRIKARAIEKMCLYQKDVP